MRPLVAIVVAAVLVACEMGASTTDGGARVPRDGGARADSGRPPDGGSTFVDGGVRRDGGAHHDGGALATCGNGRLDLGERCDPAIVAGAGRCPSECAELACSAVSLVGFACDVHCDATPATGCLDEDGCCPAGCDALTDDDCFDAITHYGTIYLSAYAFPTSTFSSASATFIDRLGVPSACTTTEDGYCTLYECPYPGVAPTIAYRSAGSVTISGGRSGTIVLSPNPDGTYPPVSFSGSVTEFAAGSAITVSATGSTIPAFAIASTFPSAVVPLSPTPVMTATGLRMSATRSAGIGFSWTGESSDEVVAGISQVVGSTSRSVSCRFPNAARSGTMSPTLLARLSPTVAGVPGTYVSMNHGGKVARVIVGTSYVSLYMNGSTGMSAQVDLH